MPAPNVIPAVMRSKLVLEAASQLVETNTWKYKQSILTMRVQGDEAQSVTILASDAPPALEEVASGRADIAIINPTGVLTEAYLGKGPFAKPMPFRVIIVMPSYDQLLFGVTAKSGITSLQDIKEKKYPLKVSLRGQRDHSVHMVIDQVLSAAGFTLEDIRTWGGEVRYDNGLPDMPTRMGAIERGEIDAIFDEAVIRWADDVPRLGMRILPLDEGILASMEGLGFRRGILDKASHPGLPEDVATLDFSGFAVYTRQDMPDEVVRDFCAAIEARRALMPIENGTAIPLESMAKDTPEGPLDVPLHPAAEAYWGDRGYLK
jgi:TRAP-type uncharacterized transport system substrate-binding protein